MDYMELRNACLDAVTMVTQARPEINFEIGDHRLGPVVRLRKHGRFIERIFKPEELTADYMLRMRLNEAIAELDLATQPPAADPEWVHLQDLPRSPLRPTPPSERAEQKPIVIHQDAEPRRRGRPPGPRRL